MGVTDRSLMKTWNVWKSLGSGTCTVDLVSRTYVEMRIKVYTLVDSRRVSCMTYDVLWLGSCFSISTSDF